MKTVLPLRGLSGRDRIVEIVENAEVDMATAEPDLGSPLSAMLMPDHAANTGGIIFSPRRVASVLTRTRLTQIAPAVIKPIAVYVVDLIIRPTLFYQAKNQAVGFV